MKRNEGHILMTLLTIKFYVPSRLSRNFDMIVIFRTSPVNIEYISSETKELQPLP